MNAWLWFPAIGFIIWVYACVWGLCAVFLKTLWPTEGGFLAAFWPVTLPIGLGFYVAGVLAPGEDE